jgi:RnfABCDGE-type electron transport complex G subunit
MVLVLTTVGLISGGFLAGVAKLTKERIAHNIQQEIEAAIEVVVDDVEASHVLHEEESLVIYKGLEEDGDLAGFAIQATGVGFQDKITLMFGLNEILTKITGMTIIEQKETPGLGAKITEWDAFLRYWEERDASGSLSLRKPPVRSPADLQMTEINSITAATISSRKVLEIVNLSLDRVRELIKEGKITKEGSDGH